jgi:hypothetical protein
MFFLIHFPLLICTKDMQRGHDMETLSLSLPIKKLNELINSHGIKQPNQVFLSSNMPEKLPDFTYCGLRDSSIEQT